MFHRYHLLFTFHFFLKPLQAGFLNSTEIALTKVNCSGYFSVLTLFGISVSVDTPSAWFLEHHLLVVIQDCFSVLSVAVSPRAPDMLAFPVVGFVHSGHSWFILISVQTPCMSSAGPFFSSSSPWACMPLVSSL